MGFYIPAQYFTLVVEIPDTSKALFQKHPPTTLYLLTNLETEDFTIRIQRGHI